MSDPSFSNTLAFVKNQNRSISAVERDWWNNTGSAQKASILENLDYKDIGIHTYETATENAYQQDYRAKINQLMETHYDSLPDVIKIAITETLITNGELPNPSVYKGIGQEFAVNNEVWHECDRCDESFMDEEDFAIHTEVDHGDSSELSNEAEESFEFSMNPEVSRYSLREAKKALQNIDKIVPDNTVKTTVGYNDNPNEGLYDTKKFKTGTSEDRVALEAYATENGYCNKCGIYTYASMTHHMKDRHPEVPRNQWKTLEYMGSDVSGDDRYVGDDIASKFQQNRPELEKAMGWGHKDDGWSNSFDYSNEATDDFDVNYEPNGEITQDLPTDKRSFNVEADNYPRDHKTNDDWDEDFAEIKKQYQNSGEADNYPRDHKTNDDWEDDFKQLKNDYQGRGTDVVYDKEGLSDISMVGENKSYNKISALEGIDFSEEPIDFSYYPTKAEESNKSYVTDIVKEVFEEYEKFGANESDNEIVESQIRDRKLRGYQSESIANELRITYGVSYEDAISKVNSVEVSINDNIANTFFQKNYSECNEAERAELALYAGNDE